VGKLPTRLGPHAASSWRILQRLAPALLVAAALAGCAKHRLYYWTKAGQTQQQQDADWYQCMRENTASGTEISTFAGDVAVHHSQDTYLDVAVRCMKARGYTLVKTEDR
jgi:hypothetical protein